MTSPSSSSLPLPVRLTAASWLQEWPPGAVLGEGSVEELASAGIAWHLHTQARIVRALVPQELRAAGEDPTPVSLDQAHRLLDSLEEWTQRHRAFLTWPPTTEAFCQALLRSLREHDGRAFAVVAAYPAFCQFQFRKMHASNPEFPLLEEALGRARPSRAPVSIEKVEKAGPPASAAEQEGPPDFLLEWVRVVEAAREPALARQALDQKIKELSGQAGVQGWSLFEKVLLPGLAKLEPAGLSALCDAWPSAQRFVPTDPVAWVDQARFWAMMRDAGDDRRRLLLSRGLSRLVDVEDLSDATRLQMLVKMLPFTAKKPVLFAQRLEFWKSLGGSLDAQADSAALLPDDPEIRGAQTAREWISLHENPDWNAELLKSSPPQESRFRRSSPGM